MQKWCSFGSRGAAGATDLIRRHDHVALFAFAEEDVFAEEQVVAGDGALEVRFADVVYANIWRIRAFTSASLLSRILPAA